MRTDWMETFIAELELYAQHATCADIYVSSLIIDETYPTSISHGYNGTPAGIIHCEELDGLIKKIVTEFTPQDTLSLFDKEKFTPEGKKVVDPFINRYSNRNTELSVIKQLKKLSELQKDDFARLAGDVQARLKANVVHYKYEIHAEVNALNKLKFIDLSDSRYALMVNYSPCFECAKNIISRGLKKVYYRHEWIDPRWDESSLELLRMSGVTVEHF